MAASLIGAALGAGASIFGANKAASTAKSAAKQQAKGIQQGIDESAGLYTDAQNFLAPYTASGQRYGTLMDDIVGLNGPEAQARAKTMYESNPSSNLLGDVKDETFRRGMNTWSAAGGANSGRAMEDLSRRMSDVSLNDYYQWQGLGKDMFGTGANAANASANLASNRGQQILGARTGQGTALASGTAAGGLYNAAGMAGAGNYLANFLGKTDFSKYFQPTPGTGAIPGGVGAYPY